MLLLPIGFFIFPESISANSSASIIINEISWMGTGNSANDEWIELYNGADSATDLNNWTIKSLTSKFLISLSKIIPAKGYFILERTNDDTLPNVVADQIYSGALGNNGEDLELLDADNSLIDSVNCATGWFAGDNSTKQTMERTDTGAPGDNAGDWQTSLNPGGTPAAANSSGALENTDSDEETEQQTEHPQEELSENQGEQIPKAEAGPDIEALASQEISFDGTKSGNVNQSLSYLWNFGDGSTANEITAAHSYEYPGTYIVSLSVSDSKNSATDTAKVAIYANSIIISEFIPDPEGADKENEWIELYNNSDRAADLSGWQIANSSAKTNPFIFPASTIILARQFLVLAGLTSKITINNTAGSLKLSYPNGQTGQEIKYEKAKAGQSIALSGNNQYFWTAMPTPGMANIISNAALVGTSLQPPGATYQAQEAPKTRQSAISANSLQNSTAPQGTIISYPVSGANIETAPPSGTSAAPATLINKIEEEPTPSETTQQKNGSQTASLANKLSSPPLLIASIILLGFTAGLGLVFLRKKLRRQADKITIDWQD
jgi:PKD repeat protein